MPKAHNGKDPFIQVFIISNLAGGNHVEKARFLMLRSIKITCGIQICNKAAYKKVWTLEGLGVPTAVMTILQTA